MTDPESRQAKNPLGPSGERLRASVKRLRQANGLKFKDLAERLEVLGRPIPVLGLSRLERGERRVDVDDLVALAVALGVTPNKLLLPADVDLSDDAALTPAVTSEPWSMWAWAAGEVPLGQEPASADKDWDSRRAEVAFILENQPHRFAATSRWGLVSDLLARQSSLLTVAVLNGMKAGMSTADVLTRTTTAITVALGAHHLDQAGIDIEETPEESRVVVTETFTETSDGDDRPEGGDPSARGDG